MGLRDFLSIILIWYDRQILLSIISDLMWLGEFSFYLSIQSLRDSLTQPSIKDKQLPGRYQHDPGILW